MYPQLCICPAITLQDVFKGELDAMVEKVMIPVTKLVVVQKKNNKLRIYLDPRDLNKATMHSHYPLLTIEHVATWLNKAKILQY